MLRIYVSILPPCRQAKADRWAELDAAPKARQWICPERPEAGGPADSRSRPIGRRTRKAADRSWEGKIGRFAAGWAREH